MGVVGCAVLGKENNPLYIKAFGDHDQLRFHFIVHTALDFVEEKVAAQKLDSERRVNHCLREQLVLLGLLRQRP